MRKYESRDDLKKEINRLSKCLESKTDIANQLKEQLEISFEKSLSQSQKINDLEQEKNTLLMHIKEYHKLVDMENGAAVDRLIELVEGGIPSESQQEALPSDWISVKDKLPNLDTEQSDWVLIRNSKNKVPFVARLIHWPDMDEPEWQMNGGGIAVVDEWVDLPKGI